ncbi:amidohydrolase family protein [Flavonifractor sp. HCP28S3_F3]|uniref:amidohydrolase family protein n=1 Tax=Flavonifractor sp. HCP28S3_F3 TaxID=3438939 RepID=UPI003F8BD50B
MKGNTLRKLCAVGLSLSILAGMVPALAAGSGEVADSVYINGNIYTVDEDFSTATAMAVKDDRILYVGDQAGAEAYVGAGTEVTDLNGKTVLPGLIEGHMHINNLGENQMKIDAYWKSKEAILELVRQEAEKAEPGTWIQGSGWLDTLWETPGYPTKEELDAVAPDNPVILIRSDNHMCWVNSKALELAGITKDTPDPQGGKILKTDDGEVWGCLTDTAINLVRDLVPSYTVEEQQQALLLAQDHLFSYGFTSAVNAGTTVQGLKNFEALYESGQMKLRTYPMIMLTNDLTSAEAEYIRTHEPTEELYGNRMLVRGVKIVGDGSLGSRSSAMLEDYSDAPGTKGEYRFTDEEMYEAIKLADFIIIDRDYMTCPEADIKDIQVLATYVGNELVYAKDTSDPTIVWQGDPLTFNSEIVVEPGTIYVPLNDMVNGIGATVAGENPVSVTLDDKTVQVPVKEIGGVRYVGVRALMEGLGYHTNWYQDGACVSIGKKTADEQVTPAPEVDEYSFQLGNFDGTIGAFCDVIMTGTKDLAFSDPFDPEDEPILTPYVAKKCESYGVKYYIDKDLLLTKLFAGVEMDGQWVYILYQDDAVLQQYLDLKAEEK